MFFVKYGSDASEFRYTHERTSDLDEARRMAERWLAGNGWGGWPKGELRVWVEDKRGDVVYGTPAARPPRTPDYRALGWS